MRVNKADYEMLADLLETDPNHKIFNSLATSRSYSYKFALYLMDKNLEVPEIILKAIATDAEYSSYFAVYLMKKNIEVPERFLQSIANDAKYSYYFARYLIKNNQEVPENIKLKSKEHRDDLFTENYFERIYDEVST